MTGYTACVADGATFEEFVWGCARAFGALILMRDDPSGAAVPEKFEPSDYHKKQVALSERELERLTNLSTEEWQIEWELARQDAIAETERIASKNRDNRAKFAAMLDKVKAWNPPSAEHVGMKEFMVQQLTETIKFEGDPYVSPYPASPEEMKTNRIAQHKHNIAYHREEDAKEVERTNGRNRWIAQLRDSVPQPKGKQ